MRRTLADFSSGIATGGASMFLNMEGAATCLESARIV